MQIEINCQPLSKSLQMYLPSLDIYGQIENLMINCPSLHFRYNFHDFHSPALDDPDFDAKPMVMLVGQYSTGKTTFIRYLLEQDFGGIRIGPEPTTDRWGNFEFKAHLHNDENVMFLR